MLVEESRQSPRRCRRMMMMRPPPPLLSIRAITMLPAAARPAGATRPSSRLTALLLAAALLNVRVSRERRRHPLHHDRPVRRQPFFCCIAGEPARSHCCCTCLRAAASRGPAEKCPLTTAILRFRLVRRSRRRDWNFSYELEEEDDELESSDGDFALDMDNTDTEAGVQEVSTGRQIVSRRRRRRDGATHTRARAGATRAAGAQRIEEGGRNAPLPSVRVFLLLLRAGRSSRL